MYLKRIELSGFKSFAQKTILDFLPSCSLVEKGSHCGITAIVGPNGSGKSNVADAIKWVMGEQSLKNLRGKKSEDVIFAGSGKKAQLGSARVSLFFDNTDKKIPIEFEEVTISRKIFRNGEAEYLINGSKVRLIDILDILAKAGIGQRSYCIINQGMADAVLNATPFERRNIFEEAAGVKPYQLKKERSLRKMDSTRANLLRAADLVREIEPHLRVLKRQADKARKGEEVARELREKQNILFGTLWRDIILKKENIILEKEEIGREEMKMQRKIDDIEIRVNQEAKTNVNFESQRNFLEKEREEKFVTLNEVRKNLVVIEAKIEIEKEKAKNFSRISEIPVDFPYFKGEFKKIKSEYERLEAELSKIGSLEELEIIKDELAILKKEFSRIFRELNEGKKFAQDGSAFGGQRESTINLKIIGDLEAERKIFSQKQDFISGEIDENRKKMDLLFLEDRTARRRYFELEAELRRLQESLAGIREKSNEIKIRMARIEVKEEDLGMRIKDEMNVEDPGQLSGGTTQDGIEDMEKFEREVFRLKSLTEQIGAIDPLIVEEYEETQKRYDFLTGQSRDLEEALASLVEVVKEMDEKIKISFEETFKKVNSEFSNYFKIIFGGGNAEMVKMSIEKRRSEKLELVEENGGSNSENGEPDGADPIAVKEENGIEIKACPPGKRIANLAMLSGGERSLTSLALLFAIIANSPPPFAVLDEVEAALDEANSKRFGRILNELSRHTQFILITHNRETMRQASCLYGVTMGADGVSKVLSVKLDQVGQGSELKVKN